MEGIQQAALGQATPEKASKAIVNAIEGGEPHAAVDAVRALLMMHVPLCKTVHHETRDAFVRAATEPRTAAAQREALQKLVDDLPPIHKQLLGRLANHLARIVRRQRLNGSSWRGLAAALCPVLLPSHWCRVDDGQDPGLHRLRAVTEGGQRRRRRAQVAARAREPGVVAATAGAVARQAAHRVRRLRAHAGQPLLAETGGEKEVAEARHAPAGPPPAGLGASFIRSLARVAAADAVAGAGQRGAPAADALSYACQGR